MASATIAKLESTLSHKKTWVTRNIKATKKQLEKISESNLHLLNRSLICAEDKFIEVKELSARISELYVEEELLTEATQFTTEFDNYAETTESVFESITTDIDAFKCKLAKAAAAKPTATATPAGTPGTPPPPTAKASDVKVNLPKLKIENYDGNYQEWDTFIQKFENSVDNKNIDDVLKFTYLSNFLTGKAAKAVRQDW